MKYDDEITKINLYDIGLSEEELKRRKNKKYELKKALNLRAENVSVDENMLYSIKRKIKNQRRIGMNKFKKAVIVCCTVLVIGVTGVYGGGKIISYSSSSSTLNEMKYIPSESEFTKKVGFVPKCPENLGQYKYLYSVPVDSSADDEQGNSVKKYKEINISYDVPKGNLFMSVSPYITNDQSPNSEEIDYNNKTIYYGSYEYKAVPPDYKPTEEENKKVEEGSLQIGYGSDKVEEEKTQFLMWQEGDLQYLIMDMGTEIPKDEFVNMAKQVIDMQ